MGSRRTLVALTFALGLAASFAGAVDQADRDMDVYYIGNSLTRNLPLERLAELFASAGFDYDYGMQLGGGHRLEQHLVMRNHGNAPGEGTFNTREPYGPWPEAFTQFTFDAIVLQPYRDELDKPEQISDRWPYHDAGSLQAASGLIDYARAQTRPGPGRWDREHANTDNVATGRFYIYATWPSAEEVLQVGSYADAYAQPYSGGVQMSADFYGKLVARLNQQYADLPQPVRMIPAGQVLAALDQRIRAGELPGIEAFYARNQAYYVKSRRNNKGPSPFDPDRFEPSAGVLNFYADGVHMNDQPHNGPDSGTIGSYVAALTVYATLTGQSPVGLTAEPYEQFDPQQDAALIHALQQTVWEVVTTNPHTGVTPKTAE